MQATPEEAKSRFRGTDANASFHVRHDIGLQRLALLKGTQWLTG
jgi:hypothetical protein